MCEVSETKEERMNERERGAEIEELRESLWIGMNELLLSECSHRRYIYRDVTWLAHNQSANIGTVTTDTNRNRYRQLQWLNYVCYSMLYS